MVSVGDPHSSSNRFPLGRNLYSPPSISTTAAVHRRTGRSMRTRRSNLYRLEDEDEDKDKDSYSFSSSVADKSEFVSENLTESVMDMHLGELALRNHRSIRPTLEEEEKFLDISLVFSDCSACSSDMSGELQHLASLPSPEMVLIRNDDGAKPEPEPCVGFLERENFSTEIIEYISPEDLLPTVMICIEGLYSPSVAVKRSAAAKLRLLAKNRSDNRVLIGESGAIPALMPLLKCSDPWTQEHAVTALLNLSLHKQNKVLISNAGAIKSLVYVLKTGTETSKQNAACALLSLSFLEENKSSIGACGAIPPLVWLLMSGSTRGKKDALTTLYKLCSLKQNKERAVSAGAVKPLVALVNNQGTAGLAEKAMVVLSSIAGVEEGRVSIVEEGGMSAFVESMEDGSLKEKEFAVLTLLQLCVDSISNRRLLVREGGIPLLVSLSESSRLSARAKHKAETLLSYLRESRQVTLSPTRRRN